MSRWLVAGIIALSPFSSVFGQTVLIDSGYTYRQVVSSICDDPNDLCHYQKMVSWDDSQITEFTLRRIDDQTGAVQGFMNFRVLFPNGFKKGEDVLYPGIVMLHGAGEAGRSWQGHFTYEPDDEEYDNNGLNLVHGGTQHLAAVNRNPTLPNSFPGFVIWPQNSYSGSWESGWNGGTMSPDMINVAEFVEHFIAEWHLDPDRIALHGLSNGAKGVWDLGAKRNDLFAAMLPFSGVPRDYQAQSDILVTTPIWLFQGGLDGNPTPGSAQQIISLLISKGGSPRFTLYPNLGHGVWNNAFAEPDFFPWIKSQNKKNIYVFGGVPEICEGGSLRLGFSDGFLGYQWYFDGDLIPGATERFYYAEEVGEYKVRFQRRTNGQWDESFPVEVKFKTESDFVPTVTNIGSTTLPIAAGSTSISGVANVVELTAPLGYSDYTWFKNGLEIAGQTGNTITVSTDAGSSSDQGAYTVVVLQPSGCESLHSNPITLTWTSPQPAASLPVPNITELSPTEVLLEWNDIDTETTYEIWQYRRPSSPYSGENWRLLTILPENTTSYVSKGLRPLGQYKFRLRAISSGTGIFSPESNFVIMDEDNTLPTAPTDLIVTDFDESTVSIAWSPSSDNDLVRGYELYNGGEFVTEISDNTAYTFTDLAPATTYFLNVRAVDFRGNVSPFGDGIEITTTGAETAGIAYKYYEFQGGLPGGDPLLAFDFNQTPTEEGVVSGFDISVRNRNDYFAFLFEGFIQIDVAGTYRFYTESDDGSRLFLKSDPAGQWVSVVDNDEAHGTVMQSGTFSFPTPGKYPIRVTFFENGGSENLTVKYNTGTTDNFGSATNLTNGAGRLFLIRATISTYYSASDGSLLDLNTWGTNEDGTGTRPLNFTADNQHFVISNRSVVNHAQSWTVSGNGSRIIVDNGVTLNLSAPLNAMIEAKENATININNATTPTFGSLDPTSTVNFNVNGTIPRGSYGNLNLNTPSTTKTFPSSSIFVKGQLSVEDGVTIQGTAPNLSVVNVDGDIILNGTSGTSPSQTSKYSFAFSGGTDHTIFFNGTKLDLYALSAGFDDVVTIENSSGDDPDLQLSGGNLVLKEGAVLNIGTGNLTITGNGLINPNNETGHIAMNGGDFTFQSTAQQNSSLWFHEAENLVADFTYSVAADINLILGNSVRVSGVVNVQQRGVLQAGEGNLTLLSNESATSRIAPLGGNARIAGSVNFQRFMDGQGRVYRYISSPVEGATVANLQQHVPVTGNFDGKSIIQGVPNSGPSLFLYNEENGGWQAFPETPAGNGTNLDTFRRGKGYSVFVRGSEDPTLWELTGTPFQGDVPFELTAGTGDSNDGWNLIGNPYASPIQWTGGTGSGWTSQGVGPTVSVPDNSGETTSWKYWNGSTGDLLNGVIAQGQAFWIQTTSATASLVITEEAKFAGQGTFYRTTSENINALTIAVSDGRLTDKAFIQSTKFGSDAYRKSEDAVKRANSYFNLSSESEEGISLAINVVDETFCEKLVSLRLDNAKPGDYSIAFSGLETFYHGLKVTLKDAFTDTEHQVTEDFTYGFSVTNDPLSSGSRFTVVMEKPEVETNLVTIGSHVCEDGATVRIEGVQPGVQYQLFNGATAISKPVKVGDNENTVEFAVSKELLGYGTSTLTVQAGFSGCKTVHFDQPVAVVIDSLIHPEIVATGNSQLTVNVSSAERYAWYFNGVLLDGENGSFVTPLENGNYQVEVTRGSCTETSDIFNFVTTALEGYKDGVSVYPNPFERRISIELNGQDVRHIKVRDMVGRELYSTEVAPGDDQVILDLGTLSPGSYILQVEKKRYRVIKKD